ncbi:MAG: thiamine pyrophosphate-binding protein, partial [Sphingomicrobium sp.]
MTVRLSDYVAARLVEHGITDVFMLTGGGAMHLNDALGRAAGLRYICCHHEQALAMAAESYTRLSGRLAALNVTTGPGGINALNGVHGAYTDSIAMIILSGQVKRETLRSNAPGLRQLGDQEADIVAMVTPITKFAALVDDPAEIRFLLEKALWLAEHGRPGPVWLDIPIDVQSAMIEPADLRGFDPATEDDGALEGDALREPARQLIAMLREAKRPVLLPGTGVRIAGAHDLFLKVADKLGIAIAPAWNAQDVVPDDHPLYVGRPGTVGDRAGNFAVQKSDLLLVLGCRLNVRQISYNFAAFAPDAVKVMVDVDAAELAKPTISIDLPIHAHLADFLTILLEELDGYEAPPAHAAYVEWGQQRRRKYPALLPEYWDTKGVVNPYCFVETLFDALGEDEVIVMADATAAVCTVQAAKLKLG